MDDEHEPAQRVLKSAQAAITAREFSRAANELDAILADDPEHEEALYMLAVAQRYGGQSSAALATLDKLKSVSPANGRAHQEEGHVRRAQRDAESALQAYTRALQHNPALTASARYRAQLLHHLGREREAIQAQSVFERLEGLAQPVLVAMDLMAQGKLVKAETLARRFLQDHPRHVEGMRVLAEIGSRLGVLDDAEFLLESACEFEPDNVAARIDYIQVLRKRQKFTAALAQAEHLLASDPNNPQFKSLVAIERMQVGQFADALTALDEVLEAVPGDPVTLTTRGHLQKTRGDSDAAVASYQAVTRAHPQHGEAHYALANLKTYRFSDAELQAMLAQSENPNLGFMDRVYLCFALAKAYEDRDAFGEAFAFYARGNAMKRAQSRYDAEQIHAEFAQMREICQPALFAGQEGAGDPRGDPIFLVGLPRAGSTLIEQILSSHSQVDGTLELPNVLSLVQRLRRKSHHGLGYPEVLGALEPAELVEFGAAYLDETRVHRQGAPMFVDKMPNNFRHIGLIHLMLPNARIIDARREPMACCFSGFKQLFAEGQEFSYALEDIGRYYCDYVELMAHWDEVLPGRVLRVQHEDVVDNLEYEVKRMLDYCGLPFEDACTRYWETERDVRTPSSEQVRRPIFRDSLEQWRQFEPWLDPLKTALAPVRAS